jgi:hypothetical protein
MRKLVAVSLLFVLSLAAHVASALRPVDYGDIWWNSHEEGWGLQISDQGDLLFMTFYVYDAAGKPTWFTALLSYSSTNVSGARIYSGGLYANPSGAYYGSPWTPGPAAIPVGTATFQADTSTTATLDYTVNGVPVHKPIERYAYNSMNLSGNGYIGSFIELDTLCTNPANNGPVALSGTFNITHNPPNPAVTVAVTLTDNVQTIQCTFAGSFSQAGRYGAINNGTFTCNSGDTGTFSAHDIELTSQGILARYDSVSATRGCHATGGFGGLLPN